jgi:hypothetical protein
MGALTRTAIGITNKTENGKQRRQERDKKGRENRMEREIKPMKRGKIDGFLKEHEGGGGKDKRELNTL